MKEQTVQEAASTLGEALIEIGFKLLPTDKQIGEDIFFLKMVYNAADQTTKKMFQQKYPQIFVAQRPAPTAPTFRVGDRIQQFFREFDVDGSRILSIVGRKNTANVKAIRLVDIGTNEYGTVSFVENIQHITENELLKAGADFGLTRGTYVRKTLK